MCDPGAVPPPANRRLVRLLLVLGLLGIGVLAAAAPASGRRMRSAELAPELCRTVGGGRFVDIPGFPGERIDRRLLPDIAWMRRRYDIFVTDALSTDRVHAPNGEHPIGLAIDVVPDTSVGGTWDEIGELAHLEEPVQNQPRLPFRWVGWNGDPGHGRGNHLHLSWAHSETVPGVPARVVYTRICPGASAPSGGGGHTGGAAGGSTGATRTGGVSAGSGGRNGRGTNSGGVPAPGKLSLAPVVRNDY